MEKPSQYQNQCQNFHGQYHPRTSLWPRGSEYKQLKIDAWFHKYLRRCVRARAQSPKRFGKYREGQHFPPRPFFLDHSESSRTYRGPRYTTSHVPQDIKNRVKFAESRHRGHPCRCWYELTIERALRMYHHYLDHTAPPHFRDFRSL